MANGIEEILKRSRKSWLLLAQSTIWIAGVIATFLLPPPAGTIEESRVWVRFAQFIVTVLIGCLLLLALRWTRKKHVLRWAAISVSALAFGTVAFFCYQVFAARWTVNYNQQRVVIGHTFTAAGTEYRQQNPNLTFEDIVFHFAGNVEKIWTRESLQERRLILAAVYVLAMPLFTISIISILQAINCATGEAAPRRRAPPVPSETAK